MLQKVFSCKFIVVATGCQKKRNLLFAFCNKRWDYMQCWTHKTITLLNIPFFRFNLILSYENIKITQCFSLAEAKCPCCNAVSHFPAYIPQLTWTPVCGFKAFHLGGQLVSCTYESILHIFALHLTCSE